MLKALVPLTIIPIIGFMISMGVLNSIAESMPIPEMIANITYSCSVEYQEFCGTFDNILLLKSTSVYSGLASCFIVLFYFSIAKITGTNRILISKLFPPLIPIILLLISIQTLVQGAIITYGAYIGESFLIERVHFVLIGAIGLGAGIGALQIIGAAFSLSKKLVHTQIGHVISYSDHPSIWDFVNNIANEIDSTPPANIIVGLEPTFFATAADVVGCGDRTLKGETLYLSLPLMRLFNKSELTSVIGHELGHFREKDTEFSTKFAPVYRGLGESINSLSSSGDGALSIAKLPALLLLTSMYDAFEKNVAAISREREFEADKIGVAVSSVKDLAYSLSKVVLFAPLWHNLRLDNIKRLNEGKYSDNLSLIFKDSSAYNLSKKELEHKKEEILKSIISHPTDSHPPLLERLASFGFDSKDIKVEKLLVHGDSCSDLINDIESIEEALSLQEHRLMVAMGHVTLKEDQAESGGFENIIYIMAAGMIGADGKIEQEEVVTAEQIGIQLINTFDQTDFRTFIKNLDEIPNILEVGAELCSLDQDAKKTIHSYLEAIANSDGDLAAEELELLDKLKVIWELS